MAGLFDDVGEFFTGKNQKRAAKRAKEIGQQGKEITTEGFEQATGAANALGQGGAASQAQANLTRRKQNAANAAVDASLGGSAAETSRLANETARQIASQNANLSSMQAARNAISAARTGGLNRGQAALAAGQNVGQNYTGAYQQGIGQGLNQYNTAAGLQQGRAESLANQTQAEQSLSNQAQAARGAVGTSLASTGSGQQLSAAGLQNQQATNSGAAGGAFLGGILGGAQDNAEGLAKIVSGGMKDGTESAEGGATLVGEEGPEIVQLPEESRVISNPQMRKLVRLTGAADVPALKKIIKNAPQTADAVPAQAEEKAPDMGAVLSRLTDVLENLSSRFPKENA